MKKSGNRWLFLLAAIVALAVNGSFVWGQSAAGTGNIDMERYQNPSYDTDTDTAKWDRIYFGSYPQTEVTGDSLTPAIIEADYDRNGDAIVDGVKYRRLQKSDTTNGDYFGEENSYRYFKWEQIEWRILEKDRDTLLLMADKGLDCQRYHNQDSNVTWRNSWLRSWLNANFYRTAFSGRERKCIVSRDDLEGDNLYVLSVQEASVQTYGFCPQREASSGSRRIQASDYARRRGVYLADEQGEKHCWWWLRTSEYDTKNAVRVYTDGSVDEGAVTPISKYGAVAPVLRIRLYDDNALLNPKYDQKLDRTEWSYVYFGSYSQTEVEATDEILNAKYDENSDAMVHGVRYRKAQGRYYKWEPIRWRVLQCNGSTLFVLADRGLDQKYFHENSEQSVWETCSLRAWLNDSFFHTAFQEEEQRAIAPNRIANGEDRDTIDSVYLLSAEEASNLSYGFCESGSVSSQSRRMATSDYANRKQPWVSSSDNFQWWLRTTKFWSWMDGYQAYYVDSNGRIQQDLLSDNHLICVPALHIDLASDLWSIEEGEDRDIFEQPLEVSGPQNQEVTEGSRAAFGVEASGGSRFGYTYQWYSAGSLDEPGTLIDGAVFSSYVIPADLVNLTLSGRYYYCVVTSGSQSMTSGRAKLTVQEAAKNPKPDDTPISTGSQSSSASRLEKPRLLIKLSAANAVRLSWSKVPRASSYTVYRSTSLNGTYRKIATVKKTAYIDKKLKSGKTYYYKLKAHRDSQNQSVSNVVSRKIWGTLKRPKQKRIVVKKADGRFVISWNKVKNAQKIVIQRSIDGGKYKKWKTVSAKKGKASYSYLGFARNHKYSFRLYAYYKRDGLKVSSKYSNRYAIVLK